MAERKITGDALTLFHENLTQQEKSAATVEKYCRDVRCFAAYLEGRTVSKEAVMDFKQHLISSGYAARSVNSMLASVNSFCGYPF